MFVAVVEWGWVIQCSHHIVGMKRLKAIDIYFKTKTVVVHAAKCWKPSDIFLQAFNSVIRNFTGSSTQCFKVPTALSLSLMLISYRINVESIDQVKSNLSWIFPNAARLLQTNHPKSAQNCEKSSYYQRVLTEELLRTFFFGHHSRQSSEWR